jgi:hypothetical protein
VLSLVFVPAMFMLMDDIGTLCWRFGKKLLVSSADTEHLPESHGDHRDPPAPPGIVHSPAE